MFGQLFMFVVSAYLIYTGITTQSYLEIALGIFAMVETSNRIYQSKTGRSLFGNK